RGLFTRNNGTTKGGVPGSPKPLTPEEQAAIAAPPGSAAAGAAPAEPGFAQKLAQSQRTSIVQPAAPTERQLYMQQLKVRIHQQLVERLDVQNLRSLPHDTVRSEVRILIRELCQSEKGLINSTEQERLM